MSSHLGTRLEIQVTLRLGQAHYQKCHFVSPSKYQSQNHGDRVLWNYDSYEVAYKLPKSKVKVFPCLNAACVPSDLQANALRVARQGQCKPISNNKTKTANTTLKQDPKSIEKAPLPSSALLSLHPSSISDPDHLSHCVFAAHFAPACLKPFILK